MAVLSLTSAGRYLITWLFSNMPGGHSRSHFSERFRFHPKPWVYTQGFQKDTAEKVKLSRSSSINIDEGAVGSSALLKDATFIWKKCNKGMQTEFFWKLSHVCEFWAPENVMQSRETFYWWCDRDETSVEEHQSAAEEHWCLHSLFWNISSNSNKLPVSWHLPVQADNSVLQQDKATGAVAGQSHGQRLAQCTGNLDGIFCSCLRAEGSTGRLSAQEY